MTLRIPNGLAHGKAFGHVCQQRFETELTLLSAPQIGDVLDDDVHADDVAIDNQGIVVGQPDAVAMRWLRISAARFTVGHRLPGLSDAPVEGLNQISARVAQHLPN